MFEPSAEKSIAIQLARERSREAAERTLMAWIRTALALIGFGFTIAKFHDYLEQSDLQLAVDPIHSALLFGGSFIAIGVFGLIAAIVQHWRILKRLESDVFVYTQPRRLPMFMAIFIVLIGLFGLMTLLVY
jgi:putative membrane protein